MNFVFISPNFPHTYWQFCDRLKKRGVNVLGIGDASYDSLDRSLRDSLTEYYRVSSMENYDEMLRAIGYFTTAKSTGSSPTTNTGWSRTPDSARISTSQRVFRQARSAPGSINPR